MKGRCEWLAGTALLLLNCAGAEAATIYNYTWTNSLQGYQVGQAHYSPTGDYAAIHGDFGGGSADHALETIGQGSLSLYVDEQSATLERIKLSTRAKLHGRNVDYQALQVSAGSNGDFEVIDLNIDYDLRGTTTAVRLSDDSISTGALSAGILESIAGFGSLTATGSSGAQLYTYVGAMVSGQHECALCIGDYTLQYNGNPLFDGAAPYFSTWLPIIGQYLDPTTGSVSSVYASLDINGYLEYQGREESPIPEPASGILLGIGAWFARQSRRSKSGTQ